MYWCQIEIIWWVGDDKKRFLLKNNISRSTVGLKFCLQVQYGGRLIHFLSATEDFGDLVILFVMTWHAADPLDYLGKHVSFFCHLFDSLNATTAAVQ